MTKILIVEDEKVLRDAFTILLEAQFYEVHQASNGKEALDRCKDTQYDLILLDIMMPVMDGLEFLKKANLSVNSPETRIVVLSNLSTEEAIQQAMLLGAHRQEIKSNLAPGDIVNLIKQELVTVAK